MSPPNDAEWGGKRGRIRKRFPTNLTLGGPPGGSLPEKMSRCTRKARLRDFFSEGQARSPVSTTPQGECAHAGPEFESIVIPQVLSSPSGMEQRFLFRSHPLC